MEKHKRCFFNWNSLSGERGAALLMVMSVSLIIVALAAPLSITQLNLSREHARAREAYKTLELMEQIGKVVLRSYEVRKRAGAICPEDYVTRGNFCFPSGNGTQQRGLFCVQDYETGNEELCVTNEDIHLMQAATTIKDSSTIAVIQFNVREPNKTWRERAVASLYRTLDWWEGRTTDPMDTLRDLYGLPHANAESASYAVEPWLHDSVSTKSTNMGTPEPSSSAACTGDYCVTCASANTECVEIQICPAWKDGKCEVAGDYYRQRFAVFD